VWIFGSRRFFATPLSQTSFSRRRLAFCSVPCPTASVWSFFFFFFHALLSLHLLFILPLCLTVMLRILVGFSRAFLSHSILTRRLSPFFFVFLGNSPSILFPPLLVFSFGRTNSSCPFSYLVLLHPLRSWWRDLLSGFPLFTVDFV